MPGTFSKLLYHIVFSTKQRRPFITLDVQPRLYEYIGGIVRSLHGVSLTIGGMPDHLHMLVGWRTDETLADLMRMVKSRSSAWLHETIPSMKSFAWQEGYAAFSVSHSQAEAVLAYIERQEEHHRVRTFEEEFREFLKRHAIEYDARYVLG